MASDLLWEAKESVAALTDTLSNACASFEIWAELRDGGKRYEYVPVVNRFHVFFETTVVAHLASMSALLYSAGETRSDTHNFPGLFKVAKRLLPCNAGLPAFEKRFSSVKPIWIKLGRIRNEVFCHRSSRRYPVEVLVDIQLVPEEIEATIRAYEEVLIGISELLGIGAQGQLKLRGRAEFEQLMLALAEGTKPPIQLR